MDSFPDTNRIIEIYRPSFRYSAPNQIEARIDPICAYALQPSKRLAQFNQKLIWDSLIGRYLVLALTNDGAGYLVCDDQLGPDVFTKFVQMMDLRLPRNRPMRRGFFTFPLSANRLFSGYRKHLCPEYTAAPGPHLRANGFVIPAKGWAPDRLVIEPTKLVTKPLMKFPGQTSRTIPRFSRAWRQSARPR